MTDNDDSENHILRAWEILHLASGKSGDLGRKIAVETLYDEDVRDFVQAHPDRFIGFTAVHPDRPVRQNLERLDRAVNEMGLRGVKLNPASGFYPNDEKLYPVYERAADMDLPVVIHSGLKPPAEGSRLKYCRPMDIDDIAVDFPDLKIIIAHAGYPWIDETIMTGLYAGNVFVDISTPHFTLY